MTIPDWRERERRELAETIRKDSYEQNGALRWKSNDAVIGLDTFRDAGLTPPPAQADEYRKYVDASIAQYREARKNYRPSAEEAFEMRAAFGPGETVVDIITGQKFKT